MRSFSTLRNVRRCGTPAGESVGIKASFGQDGTSAGVAGLTSCGSVWACAYCSAKIARARTEDLDTGMRRWVDPAWRAAHGLPGRGALALATYTISHHRGDALADLWTDMLRAWRRFTASRAYKSTRKAMGVAGYHRTTEVTYGANGWHVHFHVLYFLDDAAPVTAEDGWSLLGEWMAQARACGRKATIEGQDFKVLSGDADSLEGVSLYMLKALYDAEYVERREVAAVRGVRNLAMEVGRGDLKTDKNKATRSPFGILADNVAHILQQGCPDSTFPVWTEYEAASKGRRQQFWSRGLRDLLELGRAKTDEELADEAVEGDTLVTVSAPQWRRFSTRSDRVIALLGVVEACSDYATAQRAAGAFLDLYGIPWEPPDPAGS